MAAAVYENDLILKATELRLGLPGSDESDQEPSSTSVMVKNNKRSCSELHSSGPSGEKHDCAVAPYPKEQVVGWPPVRSYRKNATHQQQQLKQKPDHEPGSCGLLVKVSMDGAPYLRKIDLKLHNTYSDLLEALEDMFKCTMGVYSEREGYKGSEYAPTYEDKDGDWMLAGDVPWDMFMASCKRLRIMRSSQLKGLDSL